MDVTEVEEVEVTSSRECLEIQSNTGPIEIAKTISPDEETEKYSLTSIVEDVVGLGLDASKRKRIKKKKEVGTTLPEKDVPVPDKPNMPRHVTFTDHTFTVWDKGQLNKKDTWPALPPPKGQKKEIVTAKPDLDQSVAIKTTSRGWEQSSSTINYNWCDEQNTESDATQKQNNFPAMSFSDPKPSTSTNWRENDSNLETQSFLGELRPSKSSDSWRRGSYVQETSSASKTLSSASEPKESPKSLSCWRVDKIHESTPDRNVQVPPKPKRTSSNFGTCVFEIPPAYPPAVTPIGDTATTLTKLLVNYLPMEILPKKLYRYDVITKPARPRTVVRLAYNAVIKKFKNIPLGFDQTKNFYALDWLPGISLTERTSFVVDVLDEDEEEIKVEVSFKYTGIVDLNAIGEYMRGGGSSMRPPTEAIQAVDIILSQATLDSYVRVGRDYYKRPRNPINLREGFELWTGLFQSAIFTSRAFINIDVAHKAFPKHQLLIDTLVKDFGLSTSCKIEDQNKITVTAFLKYVKNLKVIAHVGNETEREFTINRLVESPEIASFTLCKKNGKRVRISVEEYFATEKNCRIKYPSLNCAWVGPVNKTIYYPMEFLKVAYGQVKPLPDKLVSKLIKDSATTPGERKQKVLEVIKDMNYSKSPYFKKFGFDISNTFHALDAKVLKTPRLDVGGDAVRPRKGVWTTPKLLRPQAVNKWGFFAIDTKFDKYDKAINLLVDAGNGMGMKIKRPDMLRLTLHITELKRWLYKAQDAGLRFVIVAISTRGFDYYQQLKRSAECEIGIVTQCIREITLENKLAESVMRNIIFKINAKLMGTNHALDSRCVPACVGDAAVMIVGADVTHPAAEERSAPSIAALTASIDSRFTQYNATLSVQESKQEIIMDFENMMVEQLNEFERRRNVLPSKIFVFRDGVSDGQFAQVLNLELPGLYEAYRRKVGPSGKRPEVLLVITQKRHHTRFFFTDYGNNVQPGTVVDTDIVHQRELDFYMVSHTVSKGTIRPTRYHVLRNDSKISSLEIEQLTFYLCHLVARCQRSVSYPTPTYYAHLACVRARSLMYGEKYSKDELKKTRRLKVAEKLNSMFFA